MILSKEFEENTKAAFMEWLNSNGEVDFDMWARDPKDYEFMKQYVPSLVVASAGGMCPFQAEGLLFGFNFYYRERHGWAELRLANAKDECYGGEGVLYSAGCEVEEFRDSSHWLPTLLELIPQLSRPPFPYLFLHKELKYTDSNDAFTAYVDEADEAMTARTGWANTPEEALEAVKKFEEIAYLTTHGITFEKQKFLHDLMLSTLQEAPANSDERKFPEVEPVFEVLRPSE